MPQQELDLEPIIEKLRWAKVLCGNCGGRYWRCVDCGIGIKHGVFTQYEGCGEHPDTPCLASCRTNNAVERLRAAAASSPPPTEPLTNKEQKHMEPTIGRILHYRLSEQDASAMTRRRTNGSSIAERMKADPPQWPAGAQAHIGNPVSAGAIVPLVVVAVWPNEFGDGIPGVNGQALLDGNDVLWVTSAKEGTEPGTWSWPTRN